MPIYEALPNGENLLPPSDPEIVLSAADDYHGIDSRYPGHIRSMIGAMREDGILTPSREMGIALHDLAADHGLKSDDPETQERAQALIMGLYEKVDNKAGLFHAINYALSADHIEETTMERWRAEVSAEFADRPVAERIQILAASRPGTAKNIQLDEEVLKSAPVYRIDLAGLSQANKEDDFEGWLVKEFELPDNIANPPPGNIAAPFRDRQEIITSVAPMLAILGYEKKASKVASEPLKYFHGTPEVVRKSDQQREKSIRHYDLINTIFRIALGEALADEDNAELRKTQISDRLKNEGQACAKFDSKEYKDCESIPDYIGCRATLPGTIDDAETVRIAEKVKTVFEEICKAALGQNDQPGLGFKLELKHPAGIKPDKDLISKPRPSGYKNYHLNYICTVDGDEVPFEVQILNQNHKDDNLWTQASHILYSERRKDIRRDAPLAKRASGQDLANLAMFRRRAEHMIKKPFSEQSNPHKWFDQLLLVPDVDMVLHRNFKVIELEKARIMLAHEHEEFVLEHLGQEGTELEGDLIFPPTHLSHSDFIELISLIDPDLRNDSQFNRAINIMHDRRFDLPKRHDGTSQLENHLYPSAFHAAVSAALTGLQWSGQQDSTEYLSDIITAVILHDSVEDVEGIEHSDIEANFSRNVARSVFHLSNISEKEIPDEFERRDASGKRLAEHPPSVIKRVSERLQNLFSDFSFLARTKNPSKMDKERIYDFAQKSYRHFTPIIDSQPMPEEIRQMYKAGMIIAYNYFKSQNLDASE